MIKYKESEKKQSKEPIMTLSEYLANFATQPRNLDTAIKRWYGEAKKSEKRTRAEWDRTINTFMNIKER